MAADDPDGGKITYGISEWEHRERCRDLAAGVLSQAAIGRKYGVTGQAIRYFAKKHADEITQIRQEGHAHG